MSIIFDLLNLVLCAFILYWSVKTVYVFVKDYKEMTRKDILLNTVIMLLIIGVGAWLLWRHNLVQAASELIQAI